MKNIKTVFSFIKDKNLNLIVAKILQNNGFLLVELENLENVTSSQVIILDDTKVTLQNCSLLYLIPYRYKFDKPEFTTKVRYLDIPFKPQQLFLALDDLLDK